MRFDLFYKISFGLCADQFIYYLAAFNKQDKPG